VFVMHACRMYMCLLCMNGSGHCYNCVVVKVDEVVFFVMMLMSWLR